MTLWFYFNFFSPKFPGVVVAFVVPIDVCSVHIKLFKMTHLHTKRVFDQFERSLHVRSACVVDETVDAKMKKILNDIMINISYRVLFFIYITK